VTSTASLQPASIVIGSPRFIISGAGITLPAGSIQFTLREADTPVTKTITVGAATRLTLDCGSVPEIVNRSFGITVHATQPIVAQRSMYFGTTPTPTGSRLP